MESVPPSSSDDRMVLSGRYELGAILGRGGMGEVRAGWDRRLSRPVAIKVLRPDMAAQPEVRLRFEHEARMAAQLVHPCVVAVFDSGEDGDGAYLVMEQLSGRTLSGRIASGLLDGSEARTVGIQVLDALDAAHRIGLVHRDIKPGNVLEAGPGAWKVGDFGIAKSLEITDPGLTSTGLVIGTPAYLAPERLAGGPATPSSDLYAVGAVLYEAMAGRRTLPGGAPLAAWANRPAPLGRARPGLPPALIALVSRAMDPDPAARFASAGAMAQALRALPVDEGGSDVAPTGAPSPPTAVLGPVGSGVIAGGPSAPTEVLTPDGGTDPARSTSAGLPGQVWASRRRRRRWAVAGVGAAAAVIALTIGLLLSSGGRTPGGGGGPTGSTVAPAGSPVTTTPASTSVPSTTTSTSTTTTSTTTTVPAGRGSGHGHGHGNGDQGH